MRLPRSTPVRLALAFLVLFVLGSAVSNLIALRVIDVELVAGEERRIHERHERFAAVLREEGAAELARVIDAIALRPDAGSDAAMLVSPQRRVLAARPAALTPLAGSLPDGWSTQPPSPAWPDADRGVKLLTEPVAGYRLIVGGSLHERDEVVEAVLGAFGWSTFVLLVLTGGGTAFIASAFRQRFDAVAATMRSVADGLLDARVRLSPRGDDIDALGADINEALERLERSVGQVRQASSDIAHDLRTPLGRLRITIEKALRAQEERAPGAALLERALDECDGIARTFASLLRIARLEARARRSGFEPVDLGALTARVVDLYEDVATDAGRAVVLAKVDGAPDERIVQGDPELLLQALANLVENALQHAPEGARVECGCREEGGYVSLSVTDDGPGVPVAERDKVLRRLYRLDSSRTTPGSGLGLSLVQAIADLHEAELALEDNAPGLRVTMRIPAGAEADGDVRGARSGFGAVAP